MEQMTKWEKAELPEKTATYSPIGHLALVQMITEGLNAQNFNVVTNSVAQSFNGEEISGHMTIGSEADGPEFRHMLAYTNSYNKRVPIRLVTGAEVFVCLNGMITGEVITMRKHTGQIESVVEGLIHKAVSNVTYESLDLIKDINEMKEIDLTRTMAAELIGRMFAEEQILTSREASMVVKEWRKPTFEDFKRNDLWSLYNHCTFALKDSRPDKKVPTLKKLHEFSMGVVEELHQLPY